MNKGKGRLSYCIVGVLVVCCFMAVLFHNQIAIRWHMIQLNNALRATHYQVPSLGLDHFESHQETYKKIASRKRALARCGFWNLYSISIPENSEIDEERLTKIAEECVSADPYLLWEHTDSTQMVFWARGKYIEQIEQAVGCPSVIIPHDK